MEFKLEETFVMVHGGRKGCDGCFFNGSLDKTVVGIEGDPCRMCIKGMVFERVVKMVKIV